MNKAMTDKHSSIYDRIDANGGNWHILVHKKGTDRQSGMVW